MNKQDRNESFWYDDSMGNEQEQVKGAEHFTDYNTLLGGEGVDIKVGEVVDVAGFSRGEYRVSDSSTDTIVFRGRQELPKFDDDVKIVPVDCQAPMHVPREQYQSWLDDIQVPAGEHQRFMVDATPLGVIKAALICARQRGLDDNEPVVQNLTNLLGIVESDSDDPQRHDLEDKIFAACAIEDLHSDYLTPVGTVSSKWANASNESGLMEVVESLLGDHNLENLVRQKLERVRQIDAIKLEQASRRHQERTGKVYDIKNPGSLVDPEILQDVDKLGVVLVRTDTSPLSTDISDGAIGMIVPASRRSERESYLRNGLYFSVGGPVEDHLEGSFSGRRFTYLLPLADTVAINGIPADLVLDDGHFSIDTGSGLHVPSSSRVIEMVDGDMTADLIAQHGNVLRIQSGNLDISKVEDILRSLARLYQLAVEGDSKEELLKAILATTSDTTNIDFLRNYLSKTEQTDAERKAVGECIRRIAVRLTIVSMGGLVDKGEQRDALVGNVEEAVRILGVNNGQKYDDQFGGMQVESIFDSGQMSSVSSGNLDQMHVVPGLNINQYDWVAYNDNAARLWDHLGTISPQMRRSAINMGVLSFAKKVSITKPAPTISQYGGFG